MIAQLLLGLLADALFGSIVSPRTSFSTEMNRYLRRRGLTQDSAARPTPAR